MIAIQNNKAITTTRCNRMHICHSELVHSVILSQDLSNTVICTLWSQCFGWINKMCRLARHYYKWYQDGSHRLQNDWIIEDCDVSMCAVSVRCVSLCSVGTCIVSVWSVGMCTLSTCSISVCNVNLYSVSMCSVSACVVSACVVSTCVVSECSVSVWGV